MQPNTINWNTARTPGTFLNLSLVIIVIYQKCTQYDKRLYYYIIIFSLFFFFWYWLRKRAKSLIDSTRKTSPPHLITCKFSVMFSFTNLSLLFTTFIFTFFFFLSPIKISAGGSTVEESEVLGELNRLFR